MNDPILIGAFATIYAAGIGAIAMIVAALICNRKAFALYRDIFLKITANLLRISRINEAKG
jgi:hypothetical protein